MLLSQIAYLLILGKPLIMYSGILTLLSLLFTASIAYANAKKIRWMPFQYHPQIAFITIILALIHGLLGLSVYFNF